ncbi:hypothetical protein [Streptomyces sp. SAI-170]|uniref:hypothetical protein n=1 Tax=Streptomyces sp. SAI-170 TaxID=3377729 RepID=UPI003C7AE2C1
MDIARPAVLTEVDESERQQLEEELQSDDDLRADLEAILAARHTEGPVEGARGVTIRREASRASLIDPEALDDIDPGGGAGERSVLALTGLAAKCGRVLMRVIQRFRAETDHWVYPTVVEELLRALYVAKAGGVLWSAMKRETLDTFDAAPDRGGRLLLDGLAQALGDGARPPITLVGHSTGAVFIDNLLNEVSRGRHQGYRPWPEDAGFHVAFLAPRLHLRADTGSAAQPLSRG